VADGAQREVRTPPADRAADVADWPTGRLLSVAARVLEQRFDHHLATQQLTHAGLIALHHLADAPLGQRPLAARCRVTEQTMSRTVERLRREGHVVTGPDARDRRRTTITLTDAGRAALEAARRAERESEDLLGAVEDYDRFRTDLVRLIRALDDRAPGG
jgi:DNA-binding MarR family transcriptional regulator